MQGPLQWWFTLSLQALGHINPPCTEKVSRIMHISSIDTFSTMYICLTQFENQIWLFWVINEWKNEALFSDWFSETLTPSSLQCIIHGFILTKYILYILYMIVSSFLHCIAMLWCMRKIQNHLMNNIRWTNLEIYLLWYMTYLIWYIIHQGKTFMVNRTGIFG